MAPNRPRYGEYLILFWSLDVLCGNLIKLSTLEAAARRLCRNSAPDSPAAILGADWALLAMRARREHLAICRECKTGAPKDSRSVQ
jgi:hypothetical protein